VLFVKIVENLWAVWALSRIPLGELTVHPRPLAGGEWDAAPPQKHHPRSRPSVFGPSEKSWARPCAGQALALTCVLLFSDERNHADSHRL